MGPVVRGSADQPPIVVFGEALNLHQRLASAIGTGAEIRMLRPLAVESTDDVLRALGLQMLCAPAEVGHLFRMPRREVRGATDVARVGGATRIAAAQRIGDAAVVDRARIAAFA